MDQKTFNTLARCWKTDSRVQFSSKAMAVVNNPAFRRMVDEGPSVIPFIFKAYEKERDHAWPIALYMLLGHSPVQYKNRGKMKEVQSDWLKWGRENGYL